MTIDVGRAAAALRALADAIENVPETTVASAPAAAPAPQKRGRGRPVVGEAQPAAAAPAADPVSSPTATSTASTAAPATAPAPDPFAATPVTAGLKATLEDVRAAYTQMKDATSADKALQILKDVGGASSGPELKPEKYDAVIAAFKAALLGAPTPVAADPFAATTAAQPTEDDVRKAFIDAGKRTSQDVAVKVVMKHGGKAVNPATGVEGPSSKALPPANYAACIAELNALPTTK